MRARETRSPKVWRICRPALGLAAAGLLMLHAAGAAGEQAEVLREYQRRNAIAEQEALRTLDEAFIGYAQRTEAFAEALTSWRARWAFAGRDITDLAERTLPLGKEPEEDDRRTAYLRSVFEETVVSHEQFRAMMDTVLNLYVYDLIANLEWLIETQEVLAGDAGAIPPDLEASIERALAAFTSVTPDVGGYASAMRRHVVTETAVWTYILVQTVRGKPGFHPVDLFVFAADMGLRWYLDRADRVDFSEAGREVLREMFHAVLEGAGDTPGFLAVLHTFRCEFEKTVLPNPGAPGRQ